MHPKSTKKIKIQRGKNGLISRRQFNLPKFVQMKFGLCSK